MSDKGEGRKAGKYEVVAQMKLFRMSNDNIAKVTGMSLEEIEAAVSLKQDEGDVPKAD